jgi:ribosomal protein L11 methyltransferase
MPWVEVSLSLGRENIEAVEQVLEQLGALAVTLEDNEDHPILEPEPGTSPLWPQVRLRGLFEQGTDRNGIMSSLQELPGGPRPDHIHWRQVDDEDWERAWMDRFRPMRFGQSLWIVPTGMEIPPDCQAIEIRLDPGLAFGTGTHPTTALCLLWLDGQELSGRKVVDYGCGSGILGIAAALKGAAAVVCVDNDPQALEATAANARRNDVGNRLRCQPPDEFALNGADIVLANILAGPLVKLAPRLAGCARPGGSIVLSGLLEDQLDSVVGAYRELCTPVHEERLDGWLRLDLRKN